ncbi:KDEL motif-containing protein 1 [Symbiodinium microadriaticum]|uniref:KDEL motif-containing protein 1 n=1 Tax=Symbiodinium microadriaticum TaxID=2951 RepID=A0A1Q9F090_SYMMI|nr:KDEL motif-containing protein 1 [Symbiodinium microadriaticum]CAE7948122.1 poglut2 [Symbiodinium sp. KB8]
MGPPDGWLMSELCHAALAFALLHFASGQEQEGNPLCWESANFQDRALSFAECCGSEGAAQACFDDMDGWYSFDFCCLPPIPEHESCHWEEVESRLEEGLRFLENFPVVLREVCCVLPHGSCWPSDTGDVLPRGFAECCFPGLRRMLLDPEGAGSWAREDLEEEFRPLEGRTWSKRQLDAFAEDMDRVRATRPGKLVDLPCRVRVGDHGREMIGCDWRQCQSSRDSANDCSYVRAVEIALRILNTHLPLPDLDLFVSPTENDFGDWPVPIFTRCRPQEPRGLYILLPFEWQLHPWQSRKATAGFKKAMAKFPWEDRTARLLWRGTNSNWVNRPCSMKRVSDGSMPWSACLAGLDDEILGLWDDRFELVWNFSNWFETPRGALVLLSQYVEGIDAKWTGISHAMEPTLWDYFEKMGMTSEPVSSMEQMKYKYGMNVEGTGNSDRIYWQLQTGQVVFSHESSQVAWLLVDLRNESRRGLLKPFQHYVPVRYDLKDLVENLDWLQRNDEAAASIAATARQAAEKYLSYDAVLYYLDRAVRRYAHHLLLDDG